MADNVSINGVTYSTDDISGVQVQRMKMQYGADGTSTDVTATTGIPKTHGYLEVSAAVSAGPSGVVVAQTDVRGYSSAYFWATGSSSNLFYVQGSEDGTNWTATKGISVGTTGSTIEEFIASAFPKHIPVGYKYIRVQVSYSSSTSTVYGRFYPTSYVPLDNNGIPVWSPGGITVVGNGSSSDSMSQFSSTYVPSLGMAFNGSSVDRLRHPNVFKTVTATASGNTAVWTPTSGKKFRLMRYKITVTNSATQASPGDVDLIFYDGASSMVPADSLYVPSTATGGLGAYTSGWVDLGNGIISAAANNVLNINLSSALTAGKVRVIVAGTEE